MRDQCVELAHRFGRDPDEVVEWWAERAAIREVEGGQARDDAEREALAEVREMLERAVSAVAGDRKGPRSSVAGGVTAKREESS
jgi:hypothetical protein